MAAPHDRQPVHFSELGVIDFIRSTNNLDTKYQVSHEEHTRSGDRYIVLTRQYLQGGQWQIGSVFRIPEALAGAFAESLSHIAAWCEPSED